MLTSSLTRTPFPHVVHAVTGTPTPQEMILAVHHTLQHDEIPVLWDVRALDPEVRLSQYEDRLRALLRSSPPQLSGRKRAFVVKASALAAFEAFLERLELSGPWSAFESYDAALIWLQE